MKFEITSTDKTGAYTMSGASVADAIRTLNLNIHHASISKAFAETVHVYKVYANGDRVSVARAFRSKSGVYKRDARA